ncbi:MAG: hypothetical protein ACKOYM_05200 [Actinomycetes bacterium]
MSELSEAPPRGGPLWPVVAATLSRPSLWGTAVRQSVHLAPRGWWRRPPFLPVPDAGYLHFRMVTAYGGDGSTPPTAEDVVAYLRWCKAWPEVARQS